MDTNQVLEKLQQIFSEEGVDCMIQEPLEEAQVPVFVMDSGKDSQGRSKTLQINVSDAMLSMESSEIHHWFRLQFDSVYPFTVKDEALSDIAQLLHLINLELEFPGFVLDYKSSQIVYRFVWVCHGNQIESVPLINYVGYIMFIQEVFSQAIEELAQDKRDLISILEEIQKS